MLSENQKFYLRTGQIPPGVHLRQFKYDFKKKATQIDEKLPKEINDFIDGILAIQEGANAKRIKLKIKDPPLECLICWAFLRINQPERLKKVLKTLQEVVKFVEGIEKQAKDRYQIIQPYLFKKEQISPFRLPTIQMMQRAMKEKIERKFGWIKKNPKAKSIFLEVMKSSAPLTKQEIIKVVTERKWLRGDETRYQTRYFSRMLNQLIKHNVFRLDNDKILITDLGKQISWYLFRKEID